MNPTRPIVLVLSFLLGGAAAAQDDQARRNRISERLSREVRSAIPPFEPGPPDPARLDPAGREPDVVTLPEVLVRERPFPRAATDEWLGPKARASRHRRTYLASLEGLSGFLNSWHIPRVTPPVGARAAAAARSERLRLDLDGLATVVDAVGTLDPAGAAELRRELFNMHTGMPPGRR